MEEEKIVLKKENTNNNIQSIRTYKDDVAQFIKGEGKTLADIAIAEAKRNEKVLKENIESEKNWSKIIKVFLIVLVLFLLTGGAIFFVIKNLNREESIVVVNPENNRKSLFISGIKEKNASVTNLNKESIIEKLDTELSNPEAFYVINLTEKKELEENFLSLNDFFEKIDIYPPGDLLRSLESQFSIGSLAGKVRFIILKNNYYPGTFASMLQWEKDIYDDLKNLLKLPKIESSIVGSTTNQSNLKKPYFTDTVISNRDARVLKDAFDNIILIYIFTDNETVVITSTESAMKIISEKLLGSKIK